MMLLITVSCGKPDWKPAPIAAGDACAFCKMAISEKRYAAQFLDPDGQATMFDEIGCMMSFLKNRPRNEVAAMFVTDYPTRQWIAADKAYYVRSSSYRTPMAGGIVAFQDAARAKEEAAKNKGELWTSEQFLQLLGKS